MATPPSTVVGVPLAIWRVVGVVTTMLGGVMGGARSGGRGEVRMVQLK